MKKMHLLLLASLSLIFLLTGCFEDEKDDKGSVSLSFTEQEALIGEEFKPLHLIRDGYLTGVAATELTESSVMVAPSLNCSTVVTGTKIEVFRKDPLFYGRDSLTVKVTYGGTELSATLYVIVQTPPVLDSIPASQVKPGGKFPPIPLLNYVTDLDEEVTTLEWDTNVTGNVTVAIDELTKIATVTAVNPLLEGTSTVTFLVTDSDRNFDTTTVAFTISKEEVPVTVVIPEQVTLIGNAFTPINILTDVTLTGISTDKVENVTIPTTDNFAVSYSFPALQVTALNPSFYGKETLTGALIHSGGKTVPFSFDVIVQTPPVIKDIPTVITITPGKVIPPVPLQNFVTDLDDAITNIVWSVTATGNINATIDPLTKVATLAAINPQLVGTSTVTFIAKDKDGNSDTVTISITINDGTIKQPPVITPAIPDQTIGKGENFLPIELAKHVEDPDGDVSTVAWSASESQAFQSGIYNGYFSVVLSNPNWVGTETITFIVTDVDGLTDTANVSFSVREKIIDKVPPIISVIPNQTIEKGQNFTAVNLQDYVTDPDGEKHLITWEATGPAEVTILLVNKVMTVVPVDKEWTGTAIVTVVATDSDGFTAEATVKFKVTGGGIVIPANDWVFDKSQVITKIENTSALLDIPPTIDTVEQEATDTTEILSTTDDSVTVYAKQESVTTKATFSNNLKIGEGLLAGLSEEEIKDSLNANSDIIAEQLKANFPADVDVDSIDIVFDDVSFGDPHLTEEATQLFVDYDVVITATITAHVNFGGFPVKLPIASKTTVSNISTYKEYDGTIPPANWPQTVVDAQ